MIGLLSKVKILDNSGGLVGRCIKVLKPGKSLGTIGDIIVLSVLKTSAGSLIQKGDVQKAIIVRVKHDPVCRWSDNAVVLIKDSDLSPIGSRIKGPISSRLSNPKLRSMAKLLI